MIEFTRFNSHNKEHVEMMNDGKDIIFEDHDGTLKFGYMYADYHGNGVTIYKFRSSEDIDAYGLYFALIERKDA